MTINTIVSLNCVLASITLIAVAIISARIYRSRQMPKVLKIISSAVVIAAATIFITFAPIRDIQRALDKNFLKYEPLRALSFGLATDGERWVEVQNAKGAVRSFVVDSATGRIVFTDVLLPYDLWHTIKF